LNGCLSREDAKRGKTGFGFILMKINSLPVFMKTFHDHFSSRLRVSNMPF
jgi:hypothetical protein